MRPSSPNRLPVLLGSGLAILLLNSCATQTKKVATSSAILETTPAEIEEVNLLAIPVALNLDQNPGTDGFVIKIYATNHRRPKPVPIESGRIDILMYDGIPGVTENTSPDPRKTWTYTAGQLKPFEIRTSIGTGYQLAPLWGDAKPVRNKIAVVVRYTPPQGPSRTSAPSIIAVALK